MSDTKYGLNIIPFCTLFARETQDLLKVWEDFLGCSKLTPKQKVKSKIWRYRNFLLEDNTSTLWVVTKLDNLIIFSLYLGKHPISLSQIKGWWLESIQVSFVKFPLLCCSILQLFYSFVMVLFSSFYKWHQKYSLGTY